ncbi:MAG: hypothetical protein JWN16_1030 [Alphaproteobacteria bacterium]|nr:hypothetical protein [Alphaproteobacteria bacterium]
MQLVQILQRALASNEIVAVIVAAILSGAGTMLMRLFVGRGKIGWGISHQYVFTLQNTPPSPSLLVYTRQIWVQNIGRSVAEEIEIVFGFKPGHFEIWPQRQFNEIVTPSNSFILKFDNLNPREHFTIMIMQTASDPPMVTNVRWKGGVGRQVVMGPQQLFPRWFTTVLRVLIWFGLFSLFYFLARPFL